MIILASASPQRKKLLENCGLEFKIIPASVDEIFDESWDKYKIASHLAFIKANKIAKLYPDDIIIGSDTIVVLNNKVYGKAETKKEAFQMLKDFSGNTHSVITGVAIIKKGQTEIFYDESFVTFRNLTDAEILNYLATEEYADKAGSYGIQGKAKELIEKFTGSLNNVIGFPTEMFMERFKVDGK
ncbi:MAG: Maf family protein [Erysipelotrichales bacterium]|nr:Maf family protein [Erysipelotrichales bacterium]